MVAQSVHERLRDPIEAVVGKVPAEQRHHPVFFRLTEQMRPVYPVAEQRSDPIGPFAVNGAPGTAQEQFGFRTHFQWQGPVSFSPRRARRFTVQHGRNKKHSEEQRGEDAVWERTHLACSVNRETVSTLEACAPRRTRIEFPSEPCHPVLHGRDARATMASWHGRPGHDTKRERFVNFVPTKWTSLA